jgi:hypothetical protein
VTWDGSHGGPVPLQSILGALVAKPRAYQVERRPERVRHLEDFIAFAAVVRPRDTLHDADSQELRTLASGIGAARQYATARTNAAASEALDAVAIMARLVEPLA